MRKLAFTLIFAVLVMVNVNAEEVYYTNGIVNLTEKEYNFVVDFYGEDYLKNMTQEDYEWISEMDVNNREVKIKTVYDGDPNAPRPYGTFVSTSAKSLSISGSCDADYCTVITLAKWLGNPSIRSYDVMGARLNNTSLYSSKETITIVNSSTSTTTPSNYRFLSKGFGNSFKLPSGTGLTIQQRFFVKPGGHVYASYQHAMSNTSLDISKSYDIGLAGYGSVFLFTGKADGKYDGMVGVDMALN